MEVEGGLLLFFSRLLPLLSEEKKVDSIIREAPRETWEQPPIAIVSIQTSCLLFKPREFRTQRRKKE